MAWSVAKNDIFFRRCQNWAAALINLLEERDRLIDLYTNEASGDAAFVDTSIATTTELIAMSGVMNAIDDVVNNGVVAQQNRMPKLTPFLADQT